MRRTGPLAALLCLAACHPAATPFVAVAAADAFTIAVFQRDGFDLAFSAVTGRDCSIVRLDRGERYCRPPEPPPTPPPFCARSLGVVDCFAEPAQLPDHPAAVADGPALSAAQARDRVARWPRL